MPLRGAARWLSRTSVETARAPAGRGLLCPDIRLIRTLTGRLASLYERLLFFLCSIQGMPLPSGVAHLILQEAQPKGPPEGGPFLSSLLPEGNSRSDHDNVLDISHKRGPCLLRDYN
jgi:hypothetical protein